MTGTPSKRLLFLTLILMGIGIGQGIWIYQQHQQIQSLHQTEYRDLFGNLEETVNEVDRFSKTQDRAVLENLYVRLTFLQRGGQQAVETTQAEPIEMHATTPGGLVDLILRHNISNEQAMTYLTQVQQKLLDYQASAAPSAEYESNQKLLIQLCRDLSHLADQKHKEWQLP